MSLTCSISWGRTPPPHPHPGCLVPPSPPPPPAPPPSTGIWGVGGSALPLNSAQAGPSEQPRESFPKKVHGSPRASPHPHHRARLGRLRCFKSRAGPACQTGISWRRLPGGNTAPILNMQRKAPLTGARANNAALCERASERETQRASGFQARLPWPGFNLKSPCGQRPSGLGPGLVDRDAGEGRGGERGLPRETAPGRRVVTPGKDCGGRDVASPWSTQKLLSLGCQPPARVGRGEIGGSSWSRDPEEQFQGRLDRGTPPV